ncbi:MAG: glycosyltransferase family 2 protein [Candidatus Paceibacterota bacterium]|jgi:glycosyltransferase involved in cell wall biosynthesis
MYNGKKVSVVFSTYREKDSLRKAIDDYFATGFVDEVIVVNNNAEPGTDEEVKKTKARLVYETKQGYGHGYQRGIAEAKGDLIFLSEPDGTYLAKDLERFLVYSKDFPVVVGTRTNQSAILEGAAMGLWRKLANVFEAKVIEVLFGTNSLTEIGCTCKLFHRDALMSLAPHWKTTNALFATELLLLTISRRLHFIEIPISFSERVGESQLTAKWHQLGKWGIRILLFILSFWFRWVFGKKAAKAS